MTAHIVTDDLKLQALYQLPLLQQSQDYDYLLTWLNHKLQLIAKNKKFTPLVVDFTTGKLGYSLAHRSVKNELLAKACGLKATKSLSLLDATAGLGQDAFMLASFNCQVILLERHPIVAGLLEDGLRRAAQDPRTADIIQGMQLMKIDAISYCTEHPQAFDVVYLDPMFPSKTKAALAKKEMQIFQAMMSDTDTDALFHAAQHCARSRLVVKRPLQAECLGNEKPHHTVEGKSHRFDVYLS